MSAPVYQRSKNLTDLLAQALNQQNPTGIGSTQPLPGFAAVTDTVGETDNGPSESDLISTGAFFVSYQDANTVTLQASPPFATGKFGDALSFNGSTQYLTVPDGSHLDLTTGFSISCWFKPVAIPGATKAIMIKGEFDNNVNYFLAITSAGKIQVGFGTGAAQRTLTGNTVLTAGTWYHIAATYNKVNLRVYVNGTQDATQGSYTDTPNSNASVVSLAATASGASLCNCLIDEARVYNTAITNLSSQALYTHVPNTAGLDAAIRADGLVLYLPFDEGSGTPLDYSGTFTGDYSDFAA